MTKIKEIGHAVLHVSNVATSSEWYCDILGMEVVIESAGFPARFLSFGRKDHDLALFQSADIAEHGGREYNHCTWQGLLLQSYCIPAIHGGQRCRCREAQGKDCS